jgi:hypothetical protein
MSNSINSISSGAETPHIQKNVKSKEGAGSFSAEMVSATNRLTSDPTPGGEITGFYYDPTNHRVYFDRPSNIDEVQVYVDSVGTFDAEGTNNYITLDDYLQSGTYATKARTRSTGGGWNAWGPEEILIVD